VSNSDSSPAEERDARIKAKAQRQSDYRQTVKWLLLDWKKGAAETNLPPMMAAKEKFLERSEVGRTYYDQELQYDTGLPVEKTVGGNETRQTAGSEPATYVQLTEVQAVMKRIMLELKEHEFGPDPYLVAELWATPMTLADVAKRMGCSVPTVEKKWEAALVYIQSCLTFWEAGKLQLNTKDKNRW